MNTRVKSVEDQIRDFYKDWCKRKKRSGGVLDGESIKELLTNLINQLKSEPGDVWVKASERLPERYVRIKWRFIYNPESISYGYEKGLGFTSFDGNKGTADFNKIEWVDENKGDNKKLLNFCHWVGNKGYKINGYDDSQLNKIIELFLSEYTTDVVNVGKVTTDGVWEKK